MRGWRRSLHALACVGVLACRPSAATGAAQSVRVGVCVPNGLFTTPTCPSFSGVRGLLLPSGRWVVVACHCCSCAPLLHQPTASLCAKHSCAVLLGRAGEKGLARLGSTLCACRECSLPRLQPCSQPRLIPFCSTPPLAPPRWAPQASVWLPACKSAPQRRGAACWTPRRSSSWRLHWPPLWSSRPPSGAADRPLRCPCCWWRCRPPSTRCSGPQG